MNRLVRMLVVPALAFAASVSPGNAAGLGGLGGLGGFGGLPRLPLPSAPPVVNRTLGTVDRAVQSTTEQAQQLVDNVGRPAVPAAFETDDRGVRVVKSEVLALSPSDAGLAAARQLNFQVLRQENLGGLNLGITVLQAPPGMSATDALNALRAADPAGTYDYNHIYDPSASGVSAGIVPAAWFGFAAERKVTIGIVDGGVDRDHPDLHSAKVITENLAGTGASPPSEHGTEVASVIAGAGPRIFGAVPGAIIYAADVYGGSPTGGSADKVAQGIAWIAGKHIPVINVSLVGPPNRLLEAVVKAAIARGQ